MELRISEPPQPAPASASARFTAFAPPPAATLSDAAMLAMVEPWPECRIVVTSPGGLELACALMRGGFADVTIARPGDRLPRCHADIVLIPEPCAPERLSAVLGWARHLLAPLGTVVLRTGGGAAGGSLRDVIPQLQAEGFVSMRTRTAGGACFIRADVPMLRRSQCA